MMGLPRRALVGLILITILGATMELKRRGRPLPRRILMDTDVDADDVFALLYLLKQSRAEFDLRAITINANGWSEAGHAVNHVYDILYMMDRDDVAVGVGGEGGISPNGTIFPHVGGYLPIIDHGMSTAGGCRYRQAIPVGVRGRLDVNTNYGLRKGFLPQVLHSGIPVTLIPLDATNTIPVSRDFLSAFERKQDTYEAQYCFQTLKIIRDTWINDRFHEAYCMWDSFMVGVALSMMRNSENQGGENEFAEMEYLNITVVTSNEPYGVLDGSNPLVEGHEIPSVNIEKNGLHTGHVQMGMHDPFCLKSGKGKCQDGFTKELAGQESVRTLVALRAKPTGDIGSPLDREFYKSFLNDINRPKQSGRFSLRTQFPYYQEVVYKPDSTRKATGKAVVFDMDMSVGDFIALIYLLKLPVELINLKGILVSPTGWATSATVDVIYDILHMMGRDDIQVGLGDVFAVGQADQNYSAIGNCKYSKAMPHGSGGSLDSDTLYGLARELPRSPRRYTAETSIKYGAPRETDHPELRQPSALDVWKSIVKSLDPGSMISVLTNGPLTTLAQIIHSERTTSVIQEVYIVGGHVGNTDEEGNVFTVPSNRYAEFNMYLDPLAAKAVLESKLDITLIPLTAQRRVSSFHEMLNNFQFALETPEATFARNLITRLSRLQQENHRYNHMDIFLGEILGAVMLAGNADLKPKINLKPVTIVAQGDESRIGQIIIDEEQGTAVKVLENVNPAAYYTHFVGILKDHRQSAMIGSFQEQKIKWNTPPNRTS